MSDRADGEGLPEVRRQVKKAEPDQIRNAIRIIYAQGDKLNVKRVIRPVRFLLDQNRLTATYRAIEEIADESEFKDQRRPWGD